MVIIIASFLFSSCSVGEFMAIGGYDYSDDVSYHIFYNANGATYGSVPVDGSPYRTGDNIYIMSNTGGLELYMDGFNRLFTGWNTEPDGTGPGYWPGTTISMGDNDITLYADWDTISAIGPGGGLVFYDKGYYSVGWRYLEAAPWDLGDFQWSNVLATLVSGTLPDLGTGFENTTLITSQPGHTTSAALECDNFSYSGYNDWYLPSINELIEINNTIGSYTSNTYFSSTEVGPDVVRAFDYSIGMETALQKVTAATVRAVRRF